MSQEQNFLLYGPLVFATISLVYCSQTCLRSRRSSGDILALAAFFSASFLSSFGLAADASLVALGVPAPLAAFGVDDVLSLILGFLAESVRWGVCYTC